MSFNATKLKASKWSVRLKNGQVQNNDGLVLERNWSGNGCDFKFIHNGTQIAVTINIIKFFQTLFNLALLSPDGPESVHEAFASCVRFNGEIRLNEKEFEIMLVADGIRRLPGEVWELELFLFLMVAVHPNCWNN